jgi:hypothetical protein
MGPAVNESERFTGIGFDPDPDEEAMLTSEGGFESVDSERRNGGKAVLRDERVRMAMPVFEETAAMGGKR